MGWGWGPIQVIEVAPSGATSECHSRLMVRVDPATSASLVATSGLTSSNARTTHAGLAARRYRRRSHQASARSLGAIGHDPRPLSAAEAVGSNAPIRRTYASPITGPPPSRAPSRIAGMRSRVAERPLAGYRARSAVMPVRRCRRGPVQHTGTRARGAGAAGGRPVGIGTRRRYRSAGGRADRDDPAHPDYSRRAQ